MTSSGPFRFAALNRKRVCALVALILLLFHAVLLGWSSFCHAPVNGEVGHLSAGISHLLFGRYDLFRVNPPLVRTLAAVPVVFASPTLNWAYYDSNPLERREFYVEHDFYQGNSQRLPALITAARWSCIAFSLLGGFFCYRWAACLYGDLAGLVALTLWCFSPGILGHAALITPDAHAAAVGAVAVFCFWRWLVRPSWKWALAAGVSLGTAELCKFTCLVFYPLLPVLWMLYRWRDRAILAWRDLLRQGGMLTGTLLASIYIVNCGYSFDGPFARLDGFQFQSMLFTGCESLDEIPPEGGNRFVGIWLGKLPLPLPANLVQGIDTQRRDFERGLPSYLRGQWADHGWWYYYLYAFALKEPLGTWCLVALSIGATILGRGYSAAGRDEMVMLLPTFVLLVFVSSQTGFSVHSRYILPVLPFLFVWTSKIVRVFEMRPFNRRRLALATSIVLALAWSVISSLSIYPHSLAYFNELAALLPTPADASPRASLGKYDEGIVSSIFSAGPRNGPRHLLDSNIDWGQDLFFLEDWYESHPDARPIRVAYYGSYPLDQSKIRSAGLPPVGLSWKETEEKTNASVVGPLPGWYALSVNYLYSRAGEYRYFLHFKPVARVSYSIYIYHINIDEANHVRRELGLPELPERCGEQAGGGDGSRDS